MMNKEEDGEGGTQNERKGRNYSEKNKMKHSIFYVIWHMLSIFILPRKLDEFSLVHSLSKLEGTKEDQVKFT